MIKSLRELSESGGSNMGTIEKYVRQSFAGAADLNLSKLLRIAAQKAVTKVTNNNELYYHTPQLAMSLFFLNMRFIIYCELMF